VASGVRYASLEQKIVAADAGDFRAKLFHAIGPTLSLDLHRSLGRSGFAWIAMPATRCWSAKRGGVRPTEFTTPTTLARSCAILDMQIGLQWTRCLPRLGKLAVRGTYDQQDWFGEGTSFATESPAANGMLGVQPDDHDIAFMGFSIGVELTR